MLESKIKVLLPTIPVALLGTLMVLVVQSAILPALAQPAQESGVRTENVTEASPEAGPNATSQDGVQGGGGAVAAAAALLRQGQISSSQSEVPGREDTQSAVIVAPRDDNAVLSGILTYHANRPVDLFVWNNVELENTTAIPEEFGDLDGIVNIGGKTFALAEVGSGNSASVPFTGNAIEVVGDEEPFIVTYSLNAFPALANLVNDIQSLTSFNATEAAAEDDAGNEEE
jgi:hypothetical protein